MAISIDSLASIFDEWLGEDNFAADREGWNIFESSGSVGGSPQIQRYDERAVFAGDSDAWLFVWTRAKAGSAMHQRALDFIRRHNEPEYARIEKHCTNLLTEG